MRIAKFGDAQFYIICGMKVRACGRQLRLAADCAARAAARRTVVLCFWDWHRLCPRGFA